VSSTGGCRYKTLRTAMRRGPDLYAATSLESWPLTKRQRQSHALVASSCLSITLEDIAGWLTGKSYRTFESRTIIPLGRKASVWPAASRSRSARSARLVAIAQPLYRNKSVGIADSPPETPRFSSTPRALRIRIR